MRKWNTYLFQYYHEGGWWILEIPAISKEDAQARLKKLPNAQYFGILGMKVPACLGFLVKIDCWWKNLWLKGGNVE